jgi:peptidoglycan hydrolase-like protein with peptidoglycan-binding domain
MTMKPRNRAEDRRMPDDEDRPRRARRRIVTGGRVVAALACLFGGTIIVNAVMMQTERHPTPLFRNAIREAESYPSPPARPDSTPRQAAMTSTQAPAARPAPSPAAPASLAPASPKPAEPATVVPGDPLLADIQRELVRRGLYKGEPNGRPGTATTQAIRDYQFSQRVPVDGKPSEALLRDLQGASRAAMRDELADLLKRSGTERPAQEDKPTRTVMDVQRALNKAGYGPLTEDGQMGPSTRNALAKFEADRKLPPRGEAKGPVLKLLAATSGVAISQ